MADISKNLKELRKNNHLTQEEVAQKIGVTRQAISSYESGRTQPGIDLLMRFAEIYGVSLEGILYGEKIANKELHYIKVISVITAFLWLISQSMNIILYFISHIFYPIPTGQISDSMKEIVELHFKYSKAADSFEGLGYTALLIGGLILCTMIIAIIGGVIVPLWKTNFLLTARLGIYRIMVFVIIDLLGQGIKNLHRKN